MGLLDRIRSALEKHEVRRLKTKISRFDTEVAKQGKRVESLTVVLNTRSGRESNRFEYILSDGSTLMKGYPLARPKKNAKNVKKPNQVTPFEKFPIDPPSRNKCTLVGRSDYYDQECKWVEEYQPGVEVVLVVRKDGIRDILKVLHSNKKSVPQNTIWWMENGEKVCKRFNVDAVRPRKEPVISFWTHYL